ncbi:MAG: hypothetical protein Q7U76_12830 [Nitrospirota bacterium]|nr:hypothetical protein [Nitrospirota bacterium]
MSELSLSRCAYLKLWRETHRALGLCSRCNEPAVVGRAKCQRHLDKDLGHYYAKQGRRPVSVREVITKAILLDDLKAVAARLGWRRITWTTYQREGSFSPSTKLMKRVGMPWSAVCVEAGLLPTAPGCKGIDQRPCRRCQKVCNYYGPETAWCKQCRRTVRRRTQEPMANWSLTTTLQ